MNTIGAVWRLNRFERLSFVNAYVLLNKTIVAERARRSAGRELLALFSNPSTPQQLHLKPLQLGQAHDVFSVLLRVVARAVIIVARIVVFTRVVLVIAPVAAAAAAARAVEVDLQAQLGERPAQQPIDAHVPAALHAACDLGKRPGCLAEAVRLQA